jgi:hypothetical protein
MRKMMKSPHKMKNMMRQMGGMPGMKDMMQGLGGKLPFSSRKIGRRGLAAPTFSKRFVPSNHATAAH